MWPVGLWFEGLNIWSDHVWTYCELRKLNFCHVTSQKLEIDQKLMRILLTELINQIRSRVMFSLASCAATCWPLGSWPWISMYALLCESPSGCESKIHECCLFLLQEFFQKQTAVAVNTTSANTPSCPSSPSSASSTATSSPCLTATATTSNITLSTCSPTYSLWWLII